METSKAYFEDILRRFDTERHGRTLFQFCRDEGVKLDELVELTVIEDLAFTPTPAQ